MYQIAKQLEVQTVVLAVLLVIIIILQICALLKSRKAWAGSAIVLTGKEFQEKWEQAQCDVFVVRKKDVVRQYIMVIGGVQFATKLTTYDYLPFEEHAKLA